MLRDKQVYFCVCTDLRPSCSADSDGQSGNTAWGPRYGDTGPIYLCLLVRAEGDQLDLLQ